MDVLEGGGGTTRIYSLSTGPTIPEWLSDRARRNVSKRDESIRRRIELLQDFAMPSSSSHLIQSSDGRYIIGTGTYPPRMRCYDLTELGMKFERYLDAECVDALFLGEDYGKVALLKEDRTVEFHAPYGRHCVMRIPTFGRAMAYEMSTCELLIACSGRQRGQVVAAAAAAAAGGSAAGGGEVYRINLEEGRFSPPLVYSSSSSSSVVGGTALAISPAHPLTALGCSDGMVRFWDNRATVSSSSSSSRLYPFLNLDVKSSTSGMGFYDPPPSSVAAATAAILDPGEVTCLSFDTTGTYLAVGTAGGCVALYDIRSSRPMHVKEHKYGLPIRAVRFHSYSGCVLSMDAKIVQCWTHKPLSSGKDLVDVMESTPHNTGTGNGNAGAGGIGKTIASVEGGTTSDLTHFIVAGDASDPMGQKSGLILCASEQPKMQSFYVPALGPAPRWCSFLDNITEELEEADGANRYLAKQDNNMGGTNDATINGAGGEVYGDYKFLTRDEVDKLGLSHLVGTPLLRGYMHGFFVDAGLYNRVKAVLNPFEYEEYRKKKIREKLEKKRASLIAPKTVSGPNTNVGQSKVNPELRERLLAKAAGERRRGKGASIAKSTLEDERFGSLFENPDFEIDEEDEYFKLRNPSGTGAIERNKRREREDMDSDDDDDDDDDDDNDEVIGFRRADTTIDDDDDDGGWDRSEDDDDYDDDDDSDDDGIRGGRVRGEAYNEMKAQSKKKKEVNGADAKNITLKKKSGHYDDDDDTATKRQREEKKKRRNKNVLYEVDDDNNDDYGGAGTRRRRGGDDTVGGDASLGIGLGDEHASLAARVRRDELSLSLEERLQRERDAIASSGVVGKIRRVRSRVGTEDETNGNDYDNGGGNARGRVGAGGDGGGREITYVPRDARKKMEREAKEREKGGGGEHGGGHERKRRNVKELGFKTPFKNTMR